MRYCLALDVAKGKSKAFLGNDAGEVLYGPEDVIHSEEDFRKLESVVKEKCPTKPAVIMEATSVYHKQPESYFRKRGYEVIVTNPLLTSMRKKSLRKIKTDDTDSEFLCNAYFSGDYSLQWDGNKPDPELQCLARRERYLTGMVSSLKNKIKQEISQCFPSLEKCYRNDEIFSDYVMRFVSRYPHPDMVSGKSEEEIAKGFSAKWKPGKYIRSGHKVLASIDSLQPSVTKEDKACHCLSRDCRLLMSLAEEKDVSIAELEEEASKKGFYPVFASFDGIGPLLASLMVSEIGNPTRFSTVGKLIAYCGLDPTIIQSGKSIHYNGPISKRGNSYMRTYLFEAVIMILRMDGTKKEKSDMTLYYKKSAVKENITTLPS